MEIDIYLEGKQLYGNDFSLEQIKQWHDEETEAYANLGNTSKNSTSYNYHNLNKIHGFNKLKKLKFENALGFGSAWGYEFEIISEKIKKLTIVEPSDNLINNKINDLTPTYVKPTIKGDLPFEDNSFDLITCFGTLHHIPNVGHIIKELVRVLKPNGHLLIREPIISMGDWRKPRNGLTKNERGIPVNFFDTEFSKYSVEIVSKDYCFTATSFLQRSIGNWFKKPLYSYKFYLFIDKILSSLLKKNVKYHAVKKIERISPQAIFYVVKKQ